MTVPDVNKSPTEDPTDRGEPLVQSVRTYLADEPHKLVVRVLPQPEPRPQSADVQIAPDAAYSRNSDDVVLKRNDLNNNSKNKFSSQKNTEESQNGQTARPVDANGMPTAAERLQRQPLLAPRSKQESHTVVSIDDSDPDADEGLRQPSQQLTNGELQMSETRASPYPKEIGKTVVAFLCLVFSVCVNMCSLSLVHERVPNRTIYGPLPDTFLDNVASHDWALSASEWIIMVSTNFAIIVIVLHKYRFIVARRIFFIMGLLYLYRSITMYVTVLPVSSTTYYCSPKANHTTAILILERMAYLMSGFGLSINGKHTYCGDYIYSGHTTILVLGYLVISEYSPRKIRFVHWISAAASFTGILLLLLAHGHYTVDVIIAYYITTRLFWTYHSMTKQFRHRNTTMITREWWYRIFMYFESNVRESLPRQYDWPLPWPKCFVKFFSRLS